MDRLIGTAALVGLVLFHAFCSSEKAPNYSFVHEASTAADVSFYDYIIVGGGTAGCPLAATLSENYKVLLLERGGSPYGNPNITYASEMGGNLYPTSSSQPFISEDGVISVRGSVLGGTSCINAGFYSRAATSYVSTAGWDGRLVKESYEWVEKKVVFKPVVKEWQSAVRDGLVEAGIVPDNGFTYDHLVGSKVGGTIFDSDGIRHTAADLLEYAHPSRLTVLLHASVQKILFKTQGSNIVGDGVVFRDEAGREHRAYLNCGETNEIILSAGAIGSPQMLMLSGVGPAEQLKAHNIDVVLEQPMVGQDMSDNPLNAVLVPSPAPVEISLAQVVGITPSQNYIEAVSGVNFLAALSSTYFHAKMDRLSSVLGKQSTGEKEVNEEYNASFRGGTLVEKFEAPLSTGHMELRTSDPNDNPSVTFNYFKEPEDLQRCVDGIKVIERVIESKAFSKFRNDSMSFTSLLNMTASAQLNLRPRNNNVSESLEQFCKDTVMTFWHYHGGCRVGRVVDQDYKVLGIDALRVLDGSTFNQTPGTNPQATLMMLGRYMGVRILNERFAKGKEFM